MFNNFTTELGQMLLISGMAHSDVLVFLVWALYGLAVLNLLVIFAVRLIAQAEDRDFNNGLSEVDVALCITSIVGATAWVYFGIAWASLATQWQAYLVFIGLVQFGGIVYRIRGGWLGYLIPGGTTPARIIWSAYITVLMLWLLHEMAPTLALIDRQGIGKLDYVAHGILTAILCYTFMLIPHGRQHDLGACTGTYMEDAWHLSCIGSMRALSIITPLAMYNSDLLWAVWVGVLHPIAYTIGQQSIVPNRWVLGDMRYPIDGATAWGEYIWGQCQTYAYVGMVGLAGYSVTLFGISLL